MSAWNYAPLAQLGKITTGSTPKSTDPDNYDGPIPFVTPSDLGSLAPIFSAARSLSTAGARTARVLPTGSVLVCCIGTVGKIGIAGTPLATNQQINAITFRNDLVDSRYGLHALHFMKTEVLSLSSATTMPIISKSRFEKLKIPVPPISVQQNIANALDYTEVLRVRRRETIALLDNLSQYIFLDMFGNPTQNPMGWPVATLNEITSEFRYGTSNKSSTTGYPVLRIPNVLGGSLNISEMKTVQVTASELDRLRLVDGDLLFVRTNGNPDYVGRCAIFTREAIETTGFPSGDFIYASYLIRARLREGNCNPVYIREFLLGPDGRRALRKQSKTSAGQFNINTQGLAGIRLTIPPLRLQEEFAQRIARVEQLKGTHSTHLAELDALFASLQHRAFRGELCTDSPAA